MYEVIWNDREVVKRHWGKAFTSEILRTSQIVQGDARFDQLRHIINDFVDCDDIVHDVLHDLEEFAARDAAAALSNRHIRVAIVGTLPRLPADADRYKNAGFSPYPIGYFTTMEDARKWLRSGSIENGLPFTRSLD